MFNQKQVSKASRAAAGAHACGVAARLTMACLLVLAAGGCYQRIEAPPTAGPPAPPPKPIPSFDDTIGAYGEIAASRGLLVHGYGLVLMPTATGSRECPPGIRKVIIEQLHRMHVGESTSALGAASMDEWINSVNTAAVLVQGYIPPGAVREDTFDVLVTALPGTQTTSLEGGVLINTELSVWARGQRGLIHGKTIAVASGPVFINPFAELNGDAASTVRARPAGDKSPGPVGTPADPRRGWVLGGAGVLRDQPISLVLRSPSYRVANICREQINMRFPSDGSDPTAKARRPTTIALLPPPQYRRQMGFWLSLVQQLYVRRDSGFLARRLVELGEELTWPDSDKARVAMTFIAIGRPAKPTVSRYYTHPDPAAAFWAAYAGLRIDDGLALDVMLQIVRDRSHPFRVQAIEALGEQHRFRGIGAALNDVMGEANPVVRTAAFQSLASLGSPLIRSRWVGEGRVGFGLDVIQCTGPYLIYVRRTGEPRLVLFGGDSLRLARPAFLHNERTGVTLTVSDTDGKLTMMRRDPASGNLIELTCPPLLAEAIVRLGEPPLKDLDGRLRGLGLHYGQVVHLLNEAIRNGALRADLYLQPVTGATLQLLAEGGVTASRGEVEFAPRVGGGGGPGGRVGPSGEGNPTTQPDQENIQIDLPAGGGPKIGG